MHALAPGPPVLRPTCLDPTVGPRPSGTVAKGESSGQGEWPCGDRVWPGVFLGVVDSVNQLAGGQLSLGWHLGPVDIRWPLANWP